MKHILLTTGLLALVIFAGCDSGANSTDPDPGTTTPAEEDTSYVPAEPAKPVATTPSVPAVDSSVEAPLDVDASESDEGEPAPVTPADFEQQLREAVAQRDMARALEVVTAALQKFPDDLAMQVNRVFVNLSLASQKQADDMAAAAQHFIDTGHLARDLESHGDALPPEAMQAIQFGLLSEARGHAYQGDIAKSLDAWRALAERGLVYFSFDEDEFFAPIRDQDEFKSELKKQMDEYAHHAISQTESFPFDFELVDLDGNTVSLEDFRGKIAIVDIWGTWCPPCREEIPHFVKLKETYPADLAVVGINYEHSEGDEAVEGIRKFAADVGINYPCVIGDQATQDLIPQLEGFPTTLFLDRDGRVRLKVVGYQPYEMLDAFVSVLMQEGDANAAG